jgi:hypothetical protein
MKKYQKGGMPQGINKSAVMPGQASIKTPPMATPKRGSGTPYSSPSSYGGMNKSAVMPGRASIKTPPMAQEPKRSSSGVVRKRSLPPRPQEAVRLLPWPRLQEGVLAERAVAPLSDPEDGYDDSTLLG